MSTRRVEGLGKKAVAVLMALCLSVMMVPAVAFAKVYSYDFALEVDASEADASNPTEGQNVTASSGNAVGIQAQNGHTATVKLGTVNASSQGSRYGVFNCANGGAIDLSMGNLTAATLYAMTANASRGGQLTIDAGDITNTNTGTAYSNGWGIDGSSTDNNSEATVTVGNIVSGGNSYGFNITASYSGAFKLNTGDVSGAANNRLKADGGTLNAKIDGSIAATSVGLDLHTSSLENSSLTAEVTGSITASSGETLRYYSGSQSNPPIKVTVGGDVAASGDGTAVDGWSGPGNVDLTVGGSVTSASGRAFSQIHGGSVIVDGDVTSGAYEAFEYVGIDGEADVLVSGTITGAESALKTSQAGYARTTLTAWKIVCGADYDLFSGDTDGTFAKRVNYIVKAEQPKVSGVTVQVTKADGTALDKSHGLEVAHEGDKVYVQVNGLSPCVKVDKAYNLVDGEKVELPKDEKGYYYTFDRMGGGNFPLEIGGANLGVDLVDNHDWEVSWRWDGDEENGYTAASALFHCNNDSSHDQQVAAELIDVLVPPTCTAGGCTRYTATVTVDGREYSDTKEIKLTPALGHDWGAWAVTTPATCSKAGVETRTCKHDATHKQTRSTAIDPNAHAWCDWQVTKESTPTASGVRTRVCAHNAKHKQTEAIAASGKLLVKMTAPKNNKKALTIAWSKKSGASGYEIYFAQCNHKNKKNICKKVKTVKSGKAGSWTKKGLKAGVSYKAFVMAYKMVNGQKEYADTSLTMHAYTSGGTKKVTNPKKVTVKSSKITVAKGQTSQIKAEVTKLSKSKKLISTGHAPTVRYISSDKSIAKVNKTGVVTGKKKGACKVYAIAANGVRATVKVTVS
ncbi:MAG: Ig-like domain-containing protein [Eggerthellaceae bacterium]|nr:Ig-like domain-containing protein [Eggerthellaceae bacterium]